ncbi:MAG: hypothetical protein VXY77_00830 [Pseudomonadota bacterium]|nr:hypothetical protein [Pseudomonadota bacterium]
MLSIDQFNQITKEKKCGITLMLPFHPVMYVKDRHPACFLIH